MSNWVWFQDALGKGTESFDLVAASGAYSLSGFSASFVRSNQLTALGGSYTYTGNDAALGKGYGLGPAASASYVLTGFSIGGFQRGHRVEAKPGEYHLTGPKQILKKTTVPIQGPAAYVETAWETLENEGDDLDAQVTVDAG